jgi:hypothetical protein
MNITYTGTYTDQLVNMSGKGYRLLTLISSGTLQVSANVEINGWLCAGGGHGIWDTSVIYNTLGGPGSRCSSGLLQLDKDVNYTVAISAAGPNNSSYFRKGSDPVDLIATGSTTGSHSGGTGGGTRLVDNFGKGDGLSKIPFVASDHFTQTPCAGGAAGRLRRYDGTFYGLGGSGGTNGGDGNTGSAGIGGFYGGGNYASNAIFYGSGGGGPQLNENSQGDVTTATLYGQGYQGVMYIRIAL